MAVGPLQSSKLESLYRRIGSFETAAEVHICGRRVSKDPGSWAHECFGRVRPWYRCAATSSSESEFEASVSPSHTDWSSSVGLAVPDDIEEEDPTAQSLNSFAALVSISFSEV